MTNYNDIIFYIYMYMYNSRNERKNSINRKVNRRLRSSITYNIIIYNTYFDTRLIHKTTRIKTWIYQVPTRIIFRINSVMIGLDLVI